MKTFLLIIVAAWCGIYACGAATPNTNGLPTRVGEAAGDLLAKVKGDIAGEMRRRMNAGSLDDKDVQELLGKVTAASNAIAGSGLNQKLEAAMRQLEKRQAEATAALNNPESKAVLQFDVQPILLRLGWLKAQNDVLLRQLADLAVTLQEMANWSKIMGQVFPEEEVGEKVKTRLGQLVTQWEQSGSGLPRAAEHTAPAAERISERKIRAPVETRPVEEQGSSVGLSPGALEVLRMVRKEASEKELARYVSRSKGRFALNAGHVVYLRRQGVPNTVIAAMLDKN